ncbi:MAG: hypothetical protein LPK43_00990 [Gammaproteobacteria bacterium]|nr:hypothetical protein [Gammaproteobacteria bacterium]
MNRHYDNPGHSINRHRRLASTLVLLWLASWMLLALEPCCEAVAAALPHAHAATADHAHSTGFTPGTQAPGHDTGAPGDEHCPSIKTPAGNAPYLPLTGDANPGTDSPKGIFTPLPRNPGLTPHVPRRHSAPVRRYVPSEQRLFLRTERLRI